MLSERWRAQLTIGQIYISLLSVCGLFIPFVFAFSFSVYSIFGVMRSTALYPSYLYLFVSYGAGVIAETAERVENSDFCYQRIEGLAEDSGDRHWRIRSWATCSLGS